MVFCSATIASKAFSSDLFTDRTKIEFIFHHLFFSFYYLNCFFTKLCNLFKIFFFSSSALGTIQLPPAHRTFSSERKSFNIIKIDPPCRTKSHTWKRSPKGFKHLNASYKCSWKKFTMFKTVIFSKHHF